MPSNLPDSPDPHAKRLRLRALIDQNRPIPVLGAADALSARQIAAGGQPAVYVGSYATAASRFGLPDTGLLSADDLIAQARSIVDAVDVPVIADAEGGFTSAGNLWKVIQGFEAAGVSAIHLEDHTGAGKHTDLPQTLRPMGEAAARIRAAVDARRDPDFLVIARTDAFWVHRDLDDCIARLRAYEEAGADMIFPSGIGLGELAAIRAATRKPIMVVDIAGAGAAQHQGANLILFYAFSVLNHYAAMQAALAEFARRDAYAGPVAQFEAFLDYRGFVDRSKRYAGD
ncbi:MAG: isocitrate lyase/PEP mutase family protein [Quisquiliibacterium sp.]